MLSMDNISLKGNNIDLIKPIANCIILEQVKLDTPHIPSIKTSKIILLLLLVRTKN